MSFNENATDEANFLTLVGLRDALVDGQYSVGDDGALTNTVREDGNTIWVLIAGFLVFFMHAGFSMLEAGSVRHRNAVNILLKNIATIGLGGLAYWFCGFTFAYGEPEGSDVSGFIGRGTDNVMLTGDDVSSVTFFFQFAFAATAATIVSGAVAGRVALPAYFGAAVWLTAFVYPVVSHWVWATGGWISAFTAQGPGLFLEEDGGCGLIDYAGSGVVHMTGGVAAFWGALVLGPRLGRWSGEEDFSAHNKALQALGTFILWFGWYGFNCGSTLAFDGVNASHVAVTTTLSPSAAVVTVMLLTRLVTKKWDLGATLNAALAGLVSITAPCSTVEPYAAILIGMIGGIIYLGSSALMKKIGVDDPVDAISVHGVCGAWGVLSVSIFSTSELIFQAYSERICETGGTMFTTQIVGVAAIFGWVTACMLPYFIVLKVLGLLRVTEEEELAGLDASEHGGAIAFIPSDEKDVDA